MILGIVIMIFKIFSSNWLSKTSSSANRAAFAVTSALTASASSFFPCPISCPICLDNLFRAARRLSASALALRFCWSKSMTSSTRGSLASWNLLRIFCFTTSGFSLTNLISNIISSYILLCNACFV